VTAPVQVLVIGFDPHAFSGEVLAELARLREAGIVRLLDLLLVQRGEDGALETFDAPGGLGAGTGALAAAILCPGDGDENGQASDDVDDPSAWSLANAVPPGSVAAVALIEHLWAGPLRAAIASAGGTPLEEAWLAPPELATLDALMANSES
jgi:uncharacterized membrane protein